MEFDADDRATSAIKQLLFGEPVKEGGASGNYAVSVQDGDPEKGTDIFMGIVNRDSTETQTANGKVEVELVGPGTKLIGYAATAANVDTASELLDFMMNYVGFDVSASSVYTIDENETSNPNGLGLCIIGAVLSATPKLIVLPHVNVTLMGTLRGQTID